MKPIGLLFVALFNSILGLSVLFPVLGPLGRDLQLSEFQVGSLSASYAFMQLVVSPYWGRRSERVGRKPVLLMGIIGFAISFYAFALVAELGTRQLLPPSLVYVGLLASRLIGGALSSATIPTAQAYVADVTPRENRTAGMATIGAAFGLGVIFGPGIGGALSTFGLLVPVYFSASLALLNALFVWLRLPEPERRQSRAAVTLSLWDARIRALLLVGTVATLAAVAMEQTIAFYFMDMLDLSSEDAPRTVGISLVLYGIVAVFVQGFLIRRFQWKPRTLMRTGLPLAALGLVGLVFAHDFATLTLALALQGMGQGFILPGVTSALSLSVGDGEQGSVAGFNSSAQALGRMAGPLLGTALYELKPQLPYVMGAGLLGVVLLALLMLRDLGRPASTAAALVDESAPAAGDTAEPPANR